MPNHVRHRLAILSGPPEELARLRNLMGSSLDFNNLVPQPDLVKSETSGVNCSHEVIAEIIGSLLKSGVPKVGNQFMDPEEELLKLRVKIETKSLRISKKDWREIGQMIGCLLETGQSNSLDWKRTNWGTKWGAYDVTQTPSGWIFNTAWSTAHPVWEKLAKEFPTLEIEIKFADEDWGRNCGTIFMHNGKVRYDQEENTDFSRSVWESTENEIARVKAEEAILN